MFLTLYVSLGHLEIILKKFMFNFVDTQNIFLVYMHYQRHDKKMNSVQEVKQ